MYTKPNGNSGLKLFPRAAKLDSFGNFIKETAIENETAVEEAKSTPPERDV